MISTMCEGIQQLVAQRNADGNQLEELWAEMLFVHFKSREIIEKYIQICQFALCLVNMLTYLLFIYLIRDPPTIHPSGYYFSTEPADYPRCPRV